MNIKLRWIIKEGKMKPFLDEEEADKFVDESDSKTFRVLDYTKLKQQLQKLGDNNKP